MSLHYRTPGRRPGCWLLRSCGCGREDKCRWQRADLELELGRQLGCRNLCDVPSWFRCGLCLGTRPLVSSVFEKGDRLILSPPFFWLYHWKTLDLKIISCIPR